MGAIDSLIQFFTTGKTTSAEGFSHSSSRSEAMARLSGWRKFCELQGLKEPSLSRLIASLGEVTNNSFDHNLGHWADVPGCAVALEREGEFLKIGVADRGQGIVQSLLSVLPQNTSNEEALKTAFNKVISGRSPEQRGNGLKFVQAQILSSPKNSLFCFSGGATYSIGTDISLQLPLDNVGTLTLIQWSLK